MATHDVTARRLYVDADLAAGVRIACAPHHAHYLRDVLRLDPGHRIDVFNGRDGEWRATLAETSRRSVVLVVDHQVRPQAGGPDIHYLFAPLKRARLDYMVQKAVELGVARLCPVLTRHTVAERVNLDRMRANAIEAAEQCGVLRLPGVDEPRRLGQVIAGWDAARRLVFCDEGAAIASPIVALRALTPGPLAVLIGPEGGFAPAERDLLLAKPFAVRLSLGPRIMRADTAAVAALALVNAVLGDWGSGVRISPLRPMKSRA
jgi:16S rRNA (uracil1498-N3)-methyltransferase